MIQSDVDRLASERFATYCRLIEKAQATLDIVDACNAGRAWADFLAVFVDARRSGTAARPVLVHSK